MKKPDAYIVVLSPKSEIGQMYSHGNFDFNEVNLNAPCLLCVELDHYDYGWLRIRRNLKPPKSFQILRIPTSAVVTIIELIDENEIPFGFTPVASAKRVAKRG